jgi:hypothetical protein
MHAVLNRRRLSQRFSSYVVGHRVVDGALTLKVTDNVYQLATRDPMTLWTDGFVYVLDRTAFNNDGAGGSEFWSHREAVVLCVISIASSWGQQSFGVDRPGRGGSIVRYGPADNVRLAAHIAQLGG